MPKKGNPLYINENAAILNFASVDLIVWNQNETKKNGANYGVRRRNILLNLPLRILIENILTRFDEKQLSMLRLVCKKLQLVIDDGYLWKQLFEQTHLIRFYAKKKSWKRIYTEYYVLGISLLEYQRRSELIPNSVEYELDITQRHMKIMV